MDQRTAKANRAAGSEISGSAAPTPDGSASRESLSGLLSRQYGVITRGQALASGLSNDMLSCRLRSGGVWQRLLPGVYLTVTGTPTRDQLELAALLYAGSGSVLTGTAALHRHGVRAPSSGTIDVLISAKRRRKSTGFVAIRLTTRLPDQVCYLGPVQYVLPARAVADSVRWLNDLASVRAIVAGVVQTKICTVEQLNCELRGGPVQGSALFRAALEEVADGVRSSSEAEFKSLLKRGKIPEPKYNAKLYSGDEFVAQADAWWPDVGVVAEVDSKEWHLSPQTWEHTMRRHARMTALGILVLHFTPRQIRHEPDEVLKIIRQALASRNGLPGPAIRTVAATG